MNTKQTNAIEFIKAQMTNGRYVIKEEGIVEYDHFVSYSIEVGLPDDEDTMAVILCRDYRHYLIGKRGGIELKTISRNGITTYPNAKGIRNAVQFI